MAKSKGSRFTPPTVNRMAGIDVERKMDMAKTHSVDNAAFLASEAEGASIVSPQGRALVLITFNGRRNHGLPGKQEVIAHPDVARELADILLRAADAAERDELEYLEFRAKGGKIREE